MKPLEGKRPERRERAGRILIAPAIKEPVLLLAYFDGSETEMKPLVILCTSVDLPLRRTFKIKKANKLINFFVCISLLDSSRENVDPSSGDQQTQPEEIDHFVTPRSSPERMEADLPMETVRRLFIHK